MSKLARMTPMVRPATRADEAGVQRVIKAVFDEYSFTWDPDEYHADIYDIDAHYLSLGHLFFVAEDGQEIVGTVALEFFETIPGDTGTIVEYQNKIRVAGTDCSLERLYVFPGARSKGIGSQLVQTVIKEASDRGRTNMELWSDKRFGDAHRLYQKFGAKVAGDRICDDPDISPEWGLLIRLK